MALLPLTFHKVTEMPAVPVANGVFMIRTGNQLRLVVTAIDGTEVDLVAPAARFEQVFATPAAQWIVNHNLGARPAAIQLLTMGGVEFDASIVHTSVNQFVVSVNPPTAGQVIVQ